MTLSVQAEEEGEPGVQMAEDEGYSSLIDLDEMMDAKEIESQPELIWEEAMRQQRQKKMLESRQPELDEIRQVFQQNLEEQQLELQQQQESLQQLVKMLKQMSDLLDQSQIYRPIAIQKLQKDQTLIKYLSEMKLKPLQQGSFIHFEIYGVHQIPFLQGQIVYKCEKGCIECFGYVIEARLDPDHLKEILNIVIANVERDMPDTAPKIIAEVKVKHSYGNVVHRALFIKYTTSNQNEAHEATPTANLTVLEVDNQNTATLIGELVETPVIVSGSVINKAQLDLDQLIQFSGITESNTSVAILKYSEAISELTFASSIIDGDKIDEGYLRNAGEENETIDFMVAHRSRLFKAVSNIKDSKLAGLKNIGDNLRKQLGDLRKQFDDLTKQLDDPQFIGPLKDKMKKALENRPDISASGFNRTGQLHQGGLFSVLQNREANLHRAACKDSQESRKSEK